MLIRQEKTKKEIINALCIIKNRLADLENEEKICYIKISLYLAVKFKLTFQNFIQHPLILVDEYFYEPKEIAETDSELKDLLSKVINFEIISDNPFLTQKELEKVISIYRKLEAKLLKVSKI